MTTEERLAKLETNQSTLFHYIENLQTELKDIRQLVTAVEKIATKVETIEGKVNSIDSRMTDVETAPAKKFDKYKEVIVSTIISLLLGGVIGALLALIIK